VHSFAGRGTAFGQENDPHSGHDMGSMETMQDMDHTTKMTSDDDAHERENDGMNHEGMDGMQPMEEKMQGDGDHTMHQMAENDNDEEDDGKVYSPHSVFQ